MRFIPSQVMNKSSTFGNSIENRFMLIVFLSVNLNFEVCESISAPAQNSSLGLERIKEEIFLTRRTLRFLLTWFGLLCEFLDTCTRLSLKLIFLLIEESPGVEKKTTTRFLCLSVSQLNNRKTKTNKRIKYSIHP